MLTVRNADDWLEENGARIRAGGLHITKSENWSHRAEHGAWLDLEGHHAWGRVTFWPDGNADMQVLDVKTSETKLYWAGKTFCDDDLKNWLEALETANVG